MPWEGAPSSPVRGLARFKKFGNKVKTLMTITMETAEEPQREALLDFFAATGGLKSYPNGWRNKTNWKKPFSDLNTWYGVTTDADGNVTNEAETSEKTEKKSVVRFSTLEILRDAGALARDQYGNYVVQHVLQHGDDVSRKSVLATLAGQIVPLAQHKFASNVVEKCLTYCGAEEREIMIGEILGDSRVRARVGSGSQSADREENEGHASGSGSDATASDATASDDARRDSPLDAPAAPAPPLRAMMKDQFANYVVQKLLEVCDDDQRERLLASARAHLQAVKKVSYGKYIVARVEKLVVAAEASGARGGGGPSADAGADDAPGERRFAGEGGGESGG